MPRTRDREANEGDDGRCKTALETGACGRQHGLDPSAHHNTNQTKPYVTYFVVIINAENYIECCGLRVNTLQIHEIQDGRDASVSRHRIFKTLS